VFEAFKQFEHFLRISSWLEVLSSRPAEVHSLLAALLDDVVDLEDHLHDLRGQEELLLLRDQRVVHVLLLHVPSALVGGVDAEAVVLLGDLLGLDSGEGLLSLVAAVLGEGEGRGLEGVGKGPHGVLFEGRHLVGGLRHGERASDLWRATTVHHSVVPDEVSRDAQGVVKTPLGLLQNHLVAATNKW